MTYVVVAALLGLLVFIHELGHFLAARLVGIPVARFSLGIGPVLTSRTVGGVRYCLSAVPFGGYVLPDLRDEAAYLASLSDERFMQLAKGSTFKISLAQEAGEINMSEFSSRTALAHYVKFSMHWVAFLARFLEPGRWLGQPLATLRIGGLALKHYALFLKTAAADALAGRKGYIPRDKRPGAKPLRELAC